jgi:hypothetical protein
MVSVEHVKYSFGPLQAFALKQEDIPYSFPMVVPADAIKNGPRFLLKFNIYASG